MGVLQFVGWVGEMSYMARLSVRYPDTCGKREAVSAEGSQPWKRARQGKSGRFSALGFVLRRLAGELVDKENERTVAAPREPGMKSFSLLLSIFRHSFSELQPFQWHQERQRPSVCCWWWPCLARGEPLHSGNSGIHGPDGVRGTSKAPGAWVRLEEVGRGVGRQRE